MKKITLWICLLLTASVSAMAQSRLADDENARSSSKSDRFFIAFTSSTYLDIVKSKLEMVETFTGNDPTGPRFEEVPHQTFSWAIVSFGIEPRYNLIEMDDNSALAFSVPVSFGLAFTQPASDEVRGVEGVGSLQIPLLCKLYVGNHSTLRTEKEFGISIGGGMEYNKLGLIDVSGDPEPAKNQGWFMPVGTIGFHFWRGMYPFEVNLKYGVTSYQTYDVDKYGSPILDEFNNLTERRTRASSFKITFVSLLNY